jgi:hypothetical protein
VCYWDGADSYTVHSDAKVGVLFVSVRCLPIISRRNRKRLELSAACISVPADDIRPTPTGAKYTPVHIIKHALSAKYVFRRAREGSSRDDERSDMVEVSVSEEKGAEMGIDSVRSVRR